MEAKQGGWTDFYINTESRCLELMAKKIKKENYIVHASHGVGKIIGMEQKKIAGKMHAYYVIKTTTLTYWLPVTDISSSHIRQICATSTFNKALSTIRRKPEELHSNYRNRKKYISEEIAKCSLSANAGLIRDLNARYAERNLHVNEQNILDKLKKNFITEYAIASGKTKAEAKEKLDDALHTAVSKMP